MTELNNIKIDIPEPVREILNRLKSNGYEAYIVGGCVRDALLGREPKDWDITTSALPLEVKSLFHNTVDTGIQHGTVMVIKNGEGFEVTTYRIDGEYKDGRHPSNVTFTRSLTEDLKRRDFTINAFAWDEDGLIDRFDGLSDIQNKIIRCVGDPNERFNEDALRIMRAVRFSAQLGFEIETDTKRMISRYASRLADISMERIRVEWEKTLISPHPEAVNEYAELGLAEYIIKDSYVRCFDPGRNPIIAELNSRRSGSEPGISEDLTGRYSEPAELYRLLMMAAFFDDLTGDETNSALRFMKYDNRTREAVSEIIRYKDACIPTDRIGIKQLLNKIGLDTFIAVAEYRDAAAAAGSGKEAAAERAGLKETAILTEDILTSGEAWNISQLAVNGSDLIAAGMPAGKKIGEMLEKMLQKVILSPTINNREILLGGEYFDLTE